MANITKLDYWVTGYGAWGIEIPILWNPQITTLDDHLSISHYFDSNTLGTGGTFHGAGKYIKEHSPNTKIILAEPGAAPLIGSGIKSERNADGSPLTSHPAFQPHPIQGEQ